MNQPAIEAQHLVKHFGKLRAVSDLTLTVHPGEVVGFLGPNGAGKTTTIRMLMGFLRPTSGSGLVLRGSLWDQPELRGRVGYLPGDFRVDPALTGWELTSWFGSLCGRFDRRRVEALAARLRLDLTRRFSDLSKGNRQKVGIVQAFMHEPDVLILDEPTSGLDPLLQREFLNLVDEAKRRGAGPVGPAMKVATSADGLIRVNSAGDELEQIFVSLYGEEAE